MVNHEATEIRGEEGIGFSEPTSLRLPSRPEYVLLARLVVSRIGEIAGFCPADIYDLKLAVTEAATNVIRHAEVGYFEIDYKVSPGCVEITVTDQGGGFDPRKLSGVPEREGGFGLAVIRSLVDEVELDSTAEGGTTLKMVRNAVDSARSGTSQR